MADVQHIRGLSELQKYLAQFPAEVGKKVLRKGASAGAAVVKEFVLPRVPIGKSTKRHVAGTMRRALRIVFRRERSNDEQAVFGVTFRKGKGAQGKLIRKGKAFQLPTDAYYAFWADQGHRIVGRQSKKKKATRRLRRAQSTARVEGANFFLPAFSASRQQATDAIVEAMQNEARGLIQS